MAIPTIRISIPEYNEVTQKMNNIHKMLLATIGIVICLLGMIPAASAEPTIIIANASADPGLTTTAEIRCHDVEHLRGFTVTLRYDPDIVMVVGEETNPEFGMDMSVIASNKTGKVVIGPLSIDADVTGADVLLATVTLRVDGNPGEESVLDITTGALIDTANAQIEPRTDIDGVFTVTGEATGPILGVNPASHDFGSIRTGNTQTQTFTFEITNSGAGTLDWNVTSDQAWIAVSPASGSDAGTVKVTADTTGLSGGAHSGTVTVSSNGGTKTVAVSVIVQLATDPTDPEPYLTTYTISNTTISPDGDWVEDYTTIDVEFSEAVEASIRIENVDGGVVKSLFICTEVTDPNPRVWTGTDDDGVIVRGGTYRVNITMDDGVNSLVYNNTEAIQVIGTGEAIISIGNGTGVVTLPITIENAVNIGACDITLTFNSSVVNVTDVTGGNFDDNVANLEHIGEGFVRIGAYQANNPGLPGDIIFANVTLEPVGDGGSISPLNLSVTTFKDATPEGKRMLYTVRNGTYITFLNGDVNSDCAVDIHDAMYLAKHVLGIEGFEKIYKETADVNGDDKITSADAMYLAKHVVGISGYEELK
ncbi:MAG: hypothetical protein EF813_06340 [Methanosarcinales archaeon]|nr:MAG: hypothetical protein EF813_06340 [Methanosarcinales archaeon]